MKIKIFEIEDWERVSFKALEKDHEVIFYHDPLDEKNVSAHGDAQIISTFIYSDLSDRILREFPDLKLIATRSTGFDHISEPFCRHNGIRVSNVPSYGSHTVAEHVFGLILLISHRLADAVERTRHGNFSLDGLQGFDLRGKRLGVLGTGEIGLRVIEIAKGFRMDVCAFDVKPEEKIAAEMGFSYVGMDELLSTSDIITLHVPANPHTHHLISDEAFSKMKDSVVLINTARGSVLDIKALVNAISRKKISAAGLDVLPEEPVIREESELLRSAFKEEHDMTTLLAGHILLRLKNVYITPHSAFNTAEAVGRIMETTMENILAFIADKPKNIVI